MLSITREQFRAAIEAGIDASDLHPNTVKALRRMAEKDTVFGTNFCSYPTPCPMGKLGFFDEDEGVAEGWAGEFAAAFDDAWLSHVPPNWYEHGDAIAVR